MVTGTTGLILFLIAVLVAVVLSTVWKFNIGIAGFFAAYILGVVICNYGAGQMAAFFPSSIIVTQFIVTLFFGFAVATGVFKGIGDRVIYKFKSKPWAVPIITAVASFIVGSLGAGNEATPLVISPLAFAFALEAGFNPLIAAGCVYFGSCWGGSLPWTSGVMLFGFCETAIGVEAGDKAMWAALIQLLIVFIIMFVFTYFICGGHKTKDLPNMSEPQPFTKEQKTVLGIVIAVIVILIVPGIINTFAPNPVCKWITKCLDIRVVCLIATIICILTHLGDTRKVLMENVPWGLLVMLGGMCMLVNVGASMGVVDMAGNWLGNSVPAMFVPAAFVLLGGLLSFLTNGLTLWPLFTAMVPGMAVATGLDPVMLCACAMLGSFPSGFSPISTGGAMATIGASDEVREKIFWPQMGVAAFGVVINVIAVQLGSVDLILSLMG